MPSDAHQQPRQVFAPGGARGRRQRLDVVAADAAQLLREAGGDLLRLRARRARAGAGSVRRCRGGTSAPRLSGSAPNRMPRAVRQDGVDRAARCRPSARSGCDLEPQELLPAMPPMVQRAWVEGSTGKNSPCARSAAFRWPSTMPGSTRRCRAAGSTRARGADASGSRSPARGSPSGRTGWCRRRAAAPGCPPRARSPARPRRPRSLRGTITPIGSTW